MVSASPLRLGQTTREVTCVATLPNGGVVSGDLGGGLRADWTGVSGLNGIRQENLAPPFRRRLAPRDVKGAVTPWRRLMTTSSGWILGFEPADAIIDVRIRCLRRIAKLDRQQEDSGFDKIQ